jgi:hypothetical protein
LPRLYSHTTGAIDEDVGLISGVEDSRLILHHYDEGQVLLAGVAFTRLGS